MVKERAWFGEGRGVVCSLVMEEGLVKGGRVKGEGNG